MPAPSGPPETRERMGTAIPADAKLYWRIYYRDATRVGSHQLAWEEAKQTDVVAVVHALNDEKPTVEIGTPYYWKYDDWIARVWDPSLYLRQTGQVKFGRWASHRLFQAAWQSALKAIGPKDEPNKLVTPECMAEGAVMYHDSWAVNEPLGTSWVLFYDNGRTFTQDDGTWAQAPTDGILCAAYTAAFSGVKLKLAIRRYTYYYWKANELINTDDLDALLMDFPQCKIGCPTFTGKSYRHMGIALTEAHQDDLSDVRQGG